MNVRPCTIVGDVYEYKNAAFTVFKSEYGDFIFEGDGLQYLDGRVLPYHLDFVEGEECVEEGREIEAYITDENIFVPSYETDTPEPNKAFLIDDEFVIRVGGWVDLEPNVIRADEADERLREVYDITLSPWRSRNPNPSLVRDSTLKEVFEESDVKRVEMV